MTQAVNLANFANNLDSSGGLNPSGLNSVVPIAKGGTNASTTAGAAANLVVEIGKLLFPIGSIYTNSANNTNPATLLGFGTWVAFGAGRVMVGLNGADALFDTLEETGGSKDAITVAHTHTATSTVTDPGHVHNVTYAAASNTSQAFPSNLSVSAFTNINTSSATTGISVSTSVSSTGASGTNANIQPYITVAMWKRTA